jgi:hypothetical protein
MNNNVCPSESILFIDKRNVTEKEVLFSPNYFSKQKRNYATHNQYKRDNETGGSTIFERR